LATEAAEDLRSGDPTIPARLAPNALRRGAGFPMDPAVAGDAPLAPPLARHAALGGHATLDGDEGEPRPPLGVAAVRAAAVAAGPAIGGGTTLVNAQPDLELAVHDCPPGWRVGH